MTQLKVTSLLYFIVGFAVLVGWLRGGDVIAFIAIATSSILKGLAMIIDTIKEGKNL